MVRINYTRYDFRDKRESLELKYTRFGMGQRLALGETVESVFKQVIEPRIHYLFVPRVAQDDLPNFDSRAKAFGYDNIFQSHRLSGRDRIGDTNQASIGLSTSVLSGDERQEYLKAGLAQTVYFAPQQSMSGEPSDMSRRGVSDLASIIRARLGDTRISSMMQWDPVGDELAAARRIEPVFGHQVLSLMTERGAERFTEFAWDYRVPRPSP